MNDSYNFNQGEISRQCIRNLCYFITILSNNDVMPRFLNEYGNYIRLCFERNLENPLIIIFNV